MARAEMQSSRAVGAFETISTWFSSDAEPKGAAKGLLERIIVEERDRSVLAVCRLRFLFGTLNALVVFPTTELEGHTALWPSRYGAVLYAVLAGLLLLLVQFKPKTRGFAAFAPAFLDVPLVGTIEYVQAQYTTAHGIGARLSQRFSMWASASLRRSTTSGVAMSP